MTTLEVEGRRLAVTNVDKVLWPVAAFTKGELIDYYVRAAPALLPHLADRHLSLRRFPDGVDGGTWYQNECRGAPSWLRTEVVRRSLRGSRVLVDWLQNDPTRSLVCAWSLRAAGWPTVATPVGWDEVERCASSGRAELLTFTWDAALDRLDRLGELHAPVLAGAQRLPPT